VTLRYLLDEHVDRALPVGLRHRTVDLVIWRIGDAGAPARSTQDPDLLVWCEADDLVLITNNRSTMPVHLADHLAAGRHLPGIFMLDPELSLGETIDELLDAAHASLANEYCDQIRYLPLT
jgi:hypothetical protein